MARYTHGPDLSDSDDSLFEDDGEYFEYKEKLKILKQQEKSAPLTQEQKRQQLLDNLFTAITSGNIANVLEILDQGIDVNLPVRDKWTSILLVASYGNPNLTKELLARGANPNSERDATTALMMACNCPEYTSPLDKSFKVIQLLVEAGASAKATDRKRMTALMFAAISGNMEAVKYLLPISDKGALDNQRWSALTWAVSYNQLEVVKLLLEEGFNINLIDIRGNTPIDIAREFNFQGILDLFPQEKEEVLYDIIDNSKLEFEANFEDHKIGQRPQFFLDICNILCSVKCETLIPTFYEKNVTFDKFLGMSDADLKEVGVLLPYQRHRILTGLHRFHKYPFHPKSIHVCLDKETYSNVDVAVQVLSAIKQMIAMEASLIYLRKTWHDRDLTKEDVESFKRSIYNIETKLKSSKMICGKLVHRFKKWDKIVEPADLITAKSRQKRLPWRKIVFSVGLASAVLLIAKFKK